MRLKVYPLVLFIVLFIGVYFLPSPVFAGNPPDQANSSLSGTTVPADGSSTSTITVTLKDSSNAPLVGDVVQLRNTTNSSIVLSPANVTLDGSGVGTFTATSTREGTDPIDIIDTTTGNTINSLGSITFGPAPTSEPAADTATIDAGCQSTAPTDAPNLFSVVGVKDSATVYFAPPVSAYDGFTISYGLDAKADAYNATFTQGPSSGAIQYTINSLTPNTKYYFQVRANNGCANGPWSSVLSTSKSTTPPVTGQINPMVIFATAAIFITGGLGIFLKYR